MENRTAQSRQIFVMDKFETHSIEELLKYTFKDKALLKKAFTHSSYANENHAESNEKLEFLGDSVLNFVISEYLYGKKSGDEGVLTIARARLVSSLPLAEAAERLGILKFILLGAGTSKENKSKKFKSNLIEAVIAAIYLDGGIVPCRKFIFENINILAEENFVDYKTKLQEYIQSDHKGKTAEYTTRSAEDGGSFDAEVILAGQIIGQGIGRRKKDAEQEAAKAACKLFGVFGENSAK